jgi:hypothetical protein
MLESSWAWLLLGGRPAIAAAPLLACDACMCLPHVPGPAGRQTQNRIQSGQRSNELPLQVIIPAVRLWDRHELAHMLAQF